MRPVPNNPSHRPTGPARRRRGSTAVLAMLFLILFSTLAVGFFASTSTSVQIAGNEHRNLQAQLAAESGMEFMKYQMATLNVPASATPANLFTHVYDRLRARLEGYPNMTGRQITMSADGNYIFVPGSGDGYITTHSNGSRFHAVLEKVQNGRKIRVKVVGRFGLSEHARAIQLEYAVAQNASSIFNYGVASRSPVSLIGNTSIVGKGDSRLGSVLSTTYNNPAITLTGNSHISGDVSLVNPGAQLDVAGNTRIAGYTPSQPEFASHVHIGVQEPEFPVIDTSDFEPFATNLITSSQGGNKTFTNIRIRANTNPSFAGNTTINGVVYIETPNRVSFTGNLKLNGVMVVQNNPSGSLTSNVIDFGGNVEFRGVETLPATFGALRELTGAMLLAPGFHVKMRGNFGVIGGSIVASKTEFSGNAGGTVKGSILNLENTAFTLNGNTDIVIESQGTSNYPAGVFFGSHYTPLRDTYMEVAP